MGVLLNSAVSAVHRGVKLRAVLAQVSLSCARPLAVAVPHRLVAGNQHVRNAGQS